MKKFIVLALVALCFQGYSQTPALQGLIADFQRGKALSLAYIDAMPEAEFDFKPAEGSRSFSEQWLHMAQGMIGLSSNGTGAEKLYPGQNLEKIPEFQSKGEVRRLVAESFDFAIAGIEAMDPATLNDIVERGPFKVSKIGWVLKAKEHTNHHRGQAAVYLRLKGVVPPQYQLF